MKAPAEILIIGPGRLGRCMSRWLSEAGRTVALIGRGESIPQAPTTWLTVPDRSIREAAQAVPEGGVVLHASGATGLDPLGPHEHIGSLHPLMTFTGGETRQEMPAAIPAAISGTDRARLAAQDLAQALDFRTFEFTGDRRIYHAAAVLSGNFATVLLARAAELLATQGLSQGEARQILAPLAARSIVNAGAAAPEEVLTGPVARGDHEVTRDHLDAIGETLPDLAGLYSTLLNTARAMMDTEEQDRG